MVLFLRATRLVHDKRQQEPAEQTASQPGSDELPAATNA
jgi:hypothetical protein